MRHIPPEELMPIFASMKLKLHPRDHMIVSLPLDEKVKALDLYKSLEPFNSITVDSEEVSLVLSVDDWENMRPNFYEYLAEGPYRVITFDIVLDLNLVGFLSVVSAVLAEAGISIYTISTYLRDHILIKSKEAAEAMRLLEKLIRRSNTN